MRLIEKNQELEKHVNVERVRTGVPNDAIQTWTGGNGRIDHR